MVLICSVKLASNASSSLIKSVSDGDSVSSSIPVFVFSKASWIESMTFFLRLS